MDGNELFGNLMIKQHDSITNWELGIYRMVESDDSTSDFRHNDSRDSYREDLKLDKNNVPRAELLYKIHNNLCSAGFTCCSTREVFIYDANDNFLGTVTKKWDGILTEVCRMYHVCPTCRCNSRDIEVEFRDGMPQVFDERLAVVNAAILSYYILWERNLFCPGL